MTYTAIEHLPGWRYRVLARGLTLDQVRDFRSPRGWAITFRQES